MADVITIKALNKYVKSLLDSDTILCDVALRGEITNFVHHYKSGHLYFSLRDEAASVKAVMFRQDAQRLAFHPEEGMRVVVRCRVSLYEATGSFQVYVTDLFPDGIGAAQMAFEQLKARLQQEGLFRPEHKRRLPARPTCIGVVTSATGAALQDIKNVLSRRWPLAKLLLASVNVQGTLAAGQIAAGIAALDQSKRADVIIVARGGGSREDLWVFNDEGIARAAYACKTPLISAVGHEIDFTILDFVADLRAPTPSAAAELATPDATEELQKICNIFVDIQENMQTRLNLCYNDLTILCNQRRILSPENVCNLHRQQLQSLQMAAAAAASSLFDHAEHRLATAGALAHSLSPYQVLARGYAMLENEQGANLHPKELLEGMRFRLKGQNTTALCRVEQVQITQENKE